MWNSVPLALQRSFPQKALDEFSEAVAQLSYARVGLLRQKTPEDAPVLKYLAERVRYVADDARYDLRVYAPLLLQRELLPHEVSLEAFEESPPPSPRPSSGSCAPAPRAEETAARAGKAFIHTSDTKARAASAAASQRRTYHCCR